MRRPRDVHSVREGVEVEEDVRAGGKVDGEGDLCGREWARAMGWSKERTERSWISTLRSSALTLRMKTLRTTSESVWYLRKRG